MTYHSISAMVRRALVSGRRRDRRPAHAETARGGGIVHLTGCSALSGGRTRFWAACQGSDVIALSLPIDYWDYLGWKDTLADSRFTTRQKAYCAPRGDRVSTRRRL